MPISIRLLCKTESKSMQSMMERFSGLLLCANAKSSIFFLFVFDFAFSFFFRFKVEIMKSACSAKRRVFGAEKR